MRRGQDMFGDWELNASRYSSFFGGGITMYGWAVVQARRRNIDRYVQSDRLGRLRSSPTAIPEDTRDICTRDIQLIEQEEILSKTNHFERLGVSASHGSL
jgi:hypothetical protein